MKNKSSVLLKTLLQSTSLLTILKNSKDKKQRGRAIAGLIGLSLIFLMAFIYTMLLGFGYGASGIAKEIPAICAVMISSLAFLFTFLKTNGYLFAFKEYDMLMSLPFEPGTIAADKFLYMYIKSLPWYEALSLALLVPYGIFQRPSLLAYPVWILLSFVLPVIPMLLASLVGFLIAKATAGFKGKTLLQTLLVFVFMFFCFSLQYIIEGFFKDGEVAEKLENVASGIHSVGDIFLPIKWFDRAVSDLDILSMLLLPGITAVLFRLVFRLVGRFYRSLNSALKTHSASGSYKLTEQKKRSVLNAIAYKEFRRMLGSVVYITNVTLGEAFAFVVGILSLLVGLEKIIAVVTEGAPVTSEMLYPAIPLIIYFLVGMVASTACSPSLEGKNYWIVQSLPIEKKTLYQGKILFNLYLTVPFMIFGVVCLSISARAPILNTILYLLQGVILCCFSSAWGCVCGVKHMRLDWENEVEVVKQGSAVAIYMLPNMFVTMGLVVLVVFLGTIMNSLLVTVIMTVVAAVLALLSYLKVLKLAK